MSTDEHPGAHRPFSPFRHYAIASLLCIVLSAAFLASLYRSVSTQSIVSLAERANLSLGNALLDAVRPQLIAFLDAADGVGSGAATAPPLPGELALALSDLMHDTLVVRVKIYNRHGTVVYSTKTSQIGRQQADNPGFIAAIEGRHASKLIYRDAFNTFDAVTEDDNLVQTYIPVRAGPTDPIHGVFEIYANVDLLVARNERALFIVLMSVALVFASLYATLLLVVRRATRIIEAQQHTIRERTATLEVLSGHMIRSEETQRRQLAYELHEGLAQTLSAAKMTVEAAAHERAAERAQASLQSVVPMLQSAIDKASDIAIALRPPSLDELGLLPTIAWFCREFGRQHPEVQIEQMLSVEERRVAAPLKVVIFRIIEAALRTIARQGCADRVQLALSGGEGAIRLRISQIASRPASLHDMSLTEVQGLFADIGERTVQSGGSFAATPNGWGGLTLSASWAC